MSNLTNFPDYSQAFTPLPGKTIKTSYPSRIIWEHVFRFRPAFGNKVLTAAKSSYKEFIYDVAPLLYSSPSAKIHFQQPAGGPDATLTSAEADEYVLIDRSRVYQDSRAANVIVFMAKYYQTKLTVLP